MRDPLGRANTRNHSLRSQPSGRMLDPVELPFTEEEVLRAASVIWSEREAKLLVSTLIQEIPRYLRYRTRRWALWRQAGYSRRDPLHGIDLPEEVLAALTVISQSAAARIAKLKRAHWRSLKSAFIKSERDVAARRAGLLPTKQQILAHLRKAGLPTDVGILLKIKRLPKATPRMVAAAEARVQRLVRKWDALCRRTRRHAQRLPASGAA
jgi:hypothetical protein